MGPSAAATPSAAHGEAPHTGAELTVLVVDDTLVGRATVSALVRRLGHRSLEASDGAEALQVFRSERPDVVLMDVVMPGMDGLEATRALRTLAADTLLPIILLSARADDRDMIAGLEAGADDYLTKPINFSILAAKLRNCVRQLSMHARLSQFRAEHEAELELARRVIDRHVQGKADDDARVRQTVIPTANLSGDVAAVARAPDGVLYALLADATGHGLAAAISALPVLQVFFGVARKGLPLGLMAAEMNRHLLTTLPVGRFVAATLLRLQPGFGEIWVGGTPEALLLDVGGGVRQRFVSTNLPLGIVDDGQEALPVVHFEWELGAQLVMCSDGLLEARSGDGRTFGRSRLEQVLGSRPRAVRHDAVREALFMHLQGACAHDDVSLMTVDLD